MVLSITGDPTVEASAHSRQNSPKCGAVPMESRHRPSSGLWRCLRPFVINGLRGLFLLLLPLCIGCGTLADFSETGGIAYGGIQRDLRTLEVVSRPGDIMDFRAVLVPMVILDMPFSLVADTAVLPYTLPHTLVAPALRRRRHRAKTSDLRISARQLADLLVLVVSKRSVRETSEFLKVANPEINPDFSENGRTMVTFALAGQDFAEMQIECDRDRIIRMTVELRRLVKAPFEGEPTRTFRRLRAALYDHYGTKDELPQECSLSYEPGRPNYFTSAAAKSVGPRPPPGTRPGRAYDVYIDFIRFCYEPGDGGAGSCACPQKPIGIGLPIAEKPRSREDGSQAGREM